ncbi:MAG: tRNA synthetase subunit beta [Desulfobulbaceae bacterium BRH_c16a]|nr:MAG: tRNA synthetase subunit beta [Desulfobulbaceae bacterium BRH_c16a]
MKFKVQPKVFEVLPNACFGVVVARGMDNRKTNPKIAALLENSIDDIRHRLKGVNVRETDEIAPYRNAFQALGYNPNKFMCSIEALVKRVLKGGMFPLINPIVDLGNAISLKHVLPIGAHDIHAGNYDIEIRFAVPEDTFIPFGATEPEAVDAGELVYAGGNSIKTRKWIWRQGVSGMITANTTDIFYPIDGFSEINDTAVRNARNELADILENTLGCRTSVGWVDRKSMELAIE